MEQQNFNQNNTMQNNRQVYEGQGNQQEINRFIQNQPGFQNQPNNFMQGYPAEGLPEVQTKKIWNQTLLALFIMAVAVIAIQILSNLIVANFFPKVGRSDWYVWALTAFAMICVALPLFYFITRSIPNSPEGDIVKLKPSQFFKYFLVCAAVMYITNFFSILLLMVIAMIKGESLNSLNPLAELFNGKTMAYSILYAAIAAPIVEELIFRKLLLSKLRRYGDIPAILITAFAFGLFHMNLAQFFYAVALGMILAYITIRTNTVRYSILLHIMINSIGTAVAPLAIKANILLSMLLVMWIFGAIAAGIVILVLDFRRIRLYKAPYPLTKRSDYFLNTGTILYTVLCLIMIILATVS
jgi:membrane protease YdiL (CAAX protease family)